MAESFPSMQEHPGSDPQNHKTSTSLGPSFHQEKAYSPWVLGGLGLLLENEIEGVLGPAFEGPSTCCFYYLCRLPSQATDSWRLRNNPVYPQTVQAASFVLSSQPDNVLSFKTLGSGISHSCLQWHQGLDCPLQCDLAGPTHIICPQPLSSFCSKLSTDGRKWILVLVFH